MSEQQTTSIPVSAHNGYVVASTHNDAHTRVSEYSITSGNLADSETTNMMDISNEQSSLVDELSTKAGSQQLCEARSRPSLMRASMNEIVLACVLLLLPVALSAVLVYLIYANLEPPNETLRDLDSITEDNRHRGLNNDEYYVNYSATRLVFISSLASTLALALVPVAMALFSYITAFTMRKASARPSIYKLPSPYQFELCVRLLGGNMLDFYRYLQYLVKPRQKKTTVPPILHSTAFMLGALLALALAVPIVDALLHIKTSSVQYNRESVYSNSNFRPGHRLPELCWNGTDAGGWTDCIYQIGGAGSYPTLQNTSEAFKVLGNVSDRSIVRLADDGETAVITVPQIPTGVSYTAHSYASSTQCKSVARLCYLGGDPCAYYLHSQCIAYNCTVRSGGLEMSGIFEGEWGQSHIDVTYYSDSSKATNITLGLNVKVPRLINGQIWSAAFLFLPNRDWPTPVPEMIDPVGTYAEPTDLWGEGLRYEAPMDLLCDSHGKTYGILSCNTTLSDVTYTSDTGGNIRALKITPMNYTAGAPFFAAFGSGN
ncbi:hypothetical protein OHC33_004642 [Knufia fluminis]|uniref:Uncharacterized protein n=1 Tax=Knufia fluminis TaxID=191047 RepID=A0AAN8F9R6_9EURO|nr:hypothetical protein OHC33_004642 [Knufia fluminis]